MSKKPKYRFTPHVNGMNGLKTIYRQDIDTGIMWMIEDFKNDGTLRNFSGRIAVYERRYRLSDLCLFWKMIGNVFFGNDEWRYEPFTEESQFDKKFWEASTTAEY